MFLIAALASLLCLAVPVSIYVRMLVTGPRTRAEIHARMSELRRTCCGHPATTDDTRSDRASSQTNTPDHAQGAAPSAKTTAAPCHPAHCNAHEVPTS